MSVNTFSNQIEEYLQKVREDPSSRNYWFAHKKISKLQKGDPDIKIALLSSHTIDLMKVYLDIDIRLLGLSPSIYIGPFNQYQQTVMDSNSYIYEFSPDVVVFNIDLQSMVTKDFMVNLPRLNPEDLKIEQNRIMKTLNTVIDHLQSQSNALILMSNFIVPTASPLGILETKTKSGLHYFVRSLNSDLAQKYMQNSQVHIVDLDLLASDFGKSKMTNQGMYYRGSILFSEGFMAYLSNYYLGYVKSLKNLNRKAIVLDLDNTLWGGIIGEDGMEGIKLNQNYPGKEFYEFQKYLKSLYNRGIILAINSKNNFEDAIEVIRDHPAMVLKEENFAIIKINWQDKVQNILEIADELNIGLDSLVFVDDNPVERIRVKTSVPEVLVVDMPKATHDYLQVFQSLSDFNTLTLTNEDLARGEMYVARQKRKTLERNIQTVDEFIKSLEITAYIERSSDFSLPRITSLVNRTNQFNLTTRRYTEQEIEDFHLSPDKMLIYTLRVTDKFGDEGIVGVAMVKPQNDELIIDNFMMSCRVIGRKIETAFLTHILNTGIKEGYKRIHGELIRSKKNKLVEKFFENHDFKIVKETEDGKEYLLELSTIKDFPEFLEIQTEV